MRFELLSHRQREILFTIISGIYACCLGLMMGRGTNLSSDRRRFAIALFSVLGLFLLAFPEVFIGVFQAGIHYNVDKIPRAGGIRFLPLLPALAAIVYLVKRGKRPFILPLNLIIVSQIALWAVFAYGLTYTYSLEQGRTLLWQFFYYNLFLCIVPMFFCNQINSLKNMIYAFGITSVLIGLSALFAYQKVWSGEAPILNWVLMADISIIACGFVFLVWLLIVKKNSQIINFLIMISMSILIFDLVLDRKRSAILGAILATMICVFLMRKLSLKIMAVVGLISICFFYSYKIIPGGRRIMYFDRSYYTDPYQSTQIRLRIWDSYLAEFQESLLLGYGTGTAYRTISIYPHNIMLEIAYQVGFIGFILFMLFLLGIVRCVWLVLRRKTRSKEHQNLMILVFCWFIVYFVFAQFAGDIIGNRNLWFLAGLIGALAKIRPAVEIE